MAMLPDFTAFMISSSLFSKVPPKNCMSSSPLERLRTSAACQSKAIGRRFRDGVEMRHDQLLGLGVRDGGREAAGDDAGHAALHEASGGASRTRLRLLIFMIVMAPSQACGLP